MVSRRRLFFLIFSLNQYLDRRFKNRDVFRTADGVNPVLLVQLLDTGLQLFRKNWEREGNVWGDCFRAAQILKQILFYQIYRIAAKKPTL